MTLDHPIFTRWPAQYPDRLQLFSLPTPNGVKVGIMLEETSFAYEPHTLADHIRLQLRDGDKQASAGRRPTMIRRPSIRTPKVPGERRRSRHSSR